MKELNVLSLFNVKPKNIAILMDEIDGMNNGDKGGINSLIKVIRPKKTRKQKIEEISFIPIICIGNLHIDKKINELLKVCKPILFLPPTNEQIYNILLKTMPKINNTEIIDTVINYIQNDLRKLISIYKLYKQNFEILNL